MPISYDRAFGGVDQRHEDPAEARCLHAQPGRPRLPQAPADRMGRRHAAAEHRGAGRAGDVAERRLPAHVLRAVGRTGSRATLRRHLRPALARRVFPFLPPDFDEQYYQAAPLDQQLPHAARRRAGRRWSISRPTAQRDFMLPHFEAPIHVFPKKGEREDGNADARHDRHRARRRAVHDDLARRRDR